MLIVALDNGKLHKSLRKRVIAVESIKDAVNDLNASLKINEINNVRSIVGDINKMHKHIKDKFDTIIFDAKKWFNHSFN